MQRVFDFRRKDGGGLKLFASAGAMPWNESVAEVMVVQDITEKVCYEQQLRESAALLENLAQQVPCIIYQFRLYPDGRSCFSYVTRNFQDIHEMQPEDAKDDATPVFRRLHTDDFERVSAGIAASARDLSVWREDYRVVLAQQGLRWRSNQMLQRSVSGTLEIISRMMDPRDPYTAGHQHRVGQNARLIGADLGLDREARELLELTGVVHDVGKIAVPTEILTKPTCLTDIELQIVRGHATAGHEIV